MAALLAPDPIPLFCSPRRGKSSASPWRRRRRRRPRRSGGGAAHICVVAASRSWTSGRPRPRPTHPSPSPGAGGPRRRGAREDVRARPHGGVGGGLSAAAIGIRLVAAGAPLTPISCKLRRRTTMAPASAQCASLLIWPPVFFMGAPAYAVARPLLERALAIRERTLGPEHPDTCDEFHNLAESLWVAKTGRARRSRSFGGRWGSPRKSLGPTIPVCDQLTSRLLTEDTNRLSEAGALPAGAVDPRNQPRPRPSPGRTGLGNLVRLLADH